MLTEKEAPLLNVHGADGIIYKTTKADGTKGYAMIFRDSEWDTPPIDVSSCFGHLFTKRRATTADYLPLHVYMEQCISEALFDHDLEAQELYSSICYRKYPFLKIESAEHLDKSKFSPFIAKRYTRVLYATTAEGDTVVADLFNDDYYHRNMALSSALRCISGDDLYTVFKDVFPNRVIYPIVSSPEESKSHFRISDTFNGCTEYWLFDFKSYTSMAPGLRKHVTEWKESVKEYVEDNMYSEDCYWEEKLYGMTECNAISVDNEIAERLSCQEKTRKKKAASSCTFDRYKRVIEGCDDSSTHWLLYGDEDVRNTLRKFGVVSAEEFLRCTK